MKLSFPVKLEFGPEIAFKKSDEQPQRNEDAPGEVSYDSHPGTTYIRNLPGD